MSVSDYVTLGIWGVGVASHVIPAAAPIVLARGAIGAEFPQNLSKKQMEAAIENLPPAKRTAHKVGTFLIDLGTFGVVATSSVGGIVHAEMTYASRTGFHDTGYMENVFPWEVTVLGLFYVLVGLGASISLISKKNWKVSLKLL